MFRLQKVRLVCTVFLALATICAGMNLATTGSIGSTPAYADDSDDLLLSIVPVLAAQARRGLIVTAPGAGETLTAGSSYTIRWIGAPQTQAVDILLSTDGGATYPITVASAVPNSLHNYSWQPVPFFDPTKLSSTCKIKICDAANPQTISAVSSGLFALAAGTMTLGELFDINNLLKLDPEGIEKDSDGDGLYDSLEIYLGTDPSSFDTDRDFYFDYDEVFGDNTFNPDDPVPNGDGDSKIAALDTDDNNDGVNDGRALDTDGDGIADYLEFYGYEYQSGGLYLYNLWNGDLAATYFKTDLKQASTDGDQYDDNMEASGVNMDRSVVPPGDHPDVAAFPNIKVRLLDYDVTLNSDITETNGRVHQKDSTWNSQTSSSSSSTVETHWDLSYEVGCGMTGCEDKVSATVGGSFAQTLTSGVARSNGGGVMNGTEWSLATCNNDTEAAKVKLNLEAINIGTCAAQNIGFVINLYIGTDLFYTYDNRSNPIAFMAVGDQTTWIAGSQTDIYLTFNELRLLETGAPIVIKVSNVTAEVLRKNGDGTWEVVGDWNPYMNEIEAISAHLYLDLGNGVTTEHLVYADDADTAPVVTVRDALRWVANAQEDPVNGPLVRFFQTDGSLGDPAPLDGWYFSLDPTTFAGIAPYLTDPGFKFFDTVLHPGTTLIAKAPPAQPTPAIRWGALSPRRGTVSAYAEDYFFSDPTKIDLKFVDKYGVPHTMNWNGTDGHGNYECACPTNADGSVYIKNGTEKIVAQNPMYNNPNDPASSNYHTELPVADMGYLASFNYPNPPTWLDTGSTTGRNDVAVSGNYAYVAAGNKGFHVVDVSNPLAPTLVGSVDTPDGAMGVFVSGNYAYIAAASGGLRIIDITDPASPSETGYFDTAGVAVGVVVSGDYAYVADAADGLRIINVSDPAHPTEAGFYDTPGTAYKVFVSGDYAYIADDDSGLEIINVSNPANPTEVGSYSTPDPDHPEYQLMYQDVFVSGAYAYVASAMYGLQIINVSDPANPTFYSGWGLGPNPYFNKIVVRNGYAFISDSTLGLRVIDINDPLHPAPVGAWPGSWNIKGLQVSGNYAFLGTQTSGLLVLDISDPANPRMPAAWAGPDYSTDVFVDGDYAYIANNAAGLQVVNISDPATPILTGAFVDPGGSESEGVFVGGSYAYVADGNFGLRIINVSDPAHPTEIIRYDTPGYAYGVYVSGDYAYVADGGDGLLVIDISNPAAPILRGALDTVKAVNVFVAGNYAYVADGSSGLKMIDISSPNAPALVGYYNTAGDANDVSVEGNYAYVSVGSYSPEDGLLIININSPGTPGAPVALPKAGQYLSGGPGRGVFVSGGYAFLALDYQGFQIIDVSNPTAPAAIRLIDTPGDAHSVFASDNRVYVAAGELELYVARFK